MLGKGLSVGLLSHCYLAGEGLCQCGQLRQSATMTWDQTTVESCVVRVSHSLSVSWVHWSITRQRTQSDQIYYITMTQNKSKPTGNYFSLRKHWSITIAPHVLFLLNYCITVLDTWKKIYFLSLKNFFKKFNLCHFSTQSEIFQYLV